MTQSKTWELRFTILTSNFFVFFLFCSFFFSSFVDFVECNCNGVQQILTKLSPTNYPTSLVLSREFASLHWKCFKTKQGKTIHQIFIFTINTLPNPCRVYIQFLTNFKPWRNNYPRTLVDNQPTYCLMWVPPNYENVLTISSSCHQAINLCLG
jgi:hypothetical protein